MGKIKIHQIFENYPDVYQPYIPPIIEGLDRNDALKITIIAYKGKSNKRIRVMPSYYKRRIVERWYRFINRTSVRLVYNEIIALKENIDIIHIQHSYLFPRVLGLANLKHINKPKLVITLRGSETYVKPWMDNKWKTFFKDYGNKIDAFVVMSNNQKLYLQRWGVEESRIYKIPISFGERYNVNPKSPSLELIKVSSVFRLCWEKNINGNLRVIKAIQDRGINVSYEIFGDGPELGKLYYLIDKYSLTEVVKVNGRVDNKILKTKLMTQDFFLQLSHSEAFPTSVIEAQSMGIPSVVSYAGGLPESIIHKKTGYCVNANDVNKAADYIIDLWKDREKYRSFSECAILNSQSNFSNFNEIKSLKLLYTNLTK